ncbi:hypothetical protein NBRC116594_21810 [Shimia sp. NS0008-38b]
MRACLQLNPDLLSGWAPIWAARRTGAGVDVVISESTAASDIPNADAVLALWGVVPGRGDLSDNLQLAQRAVEIARICGAKRVLHCSSSAVYGPGKSCCETAVLTPVNAYGVAKIEMEQSLISTPNRAETTPQSYVLRLANVVGADSLFDAMKTTNPITLDAFDVGVSPVRSYATPSLIWRAVKAVLAQESPPEILNVAAANPVSMHALLDAAGYPFVWQPAPFTAVQEVSINVDLLRRLTKRQLVMEPANMIAEWHKLRDMVT